MSIMNSFLTTLYNSTHMPMHYYKGQEIVASYPTGAIVLDLVNTYRNIITIEKHAFHYFEIDDLLFIGILASKTSDEAIVFGPISTFSLSTESIHNLILSYKLDEDKQIDFENLFEKTPSFPLHQFLSIMSLANMQLNGEYVDIMELYKQSQPDVQTKVGKEHSDELMKRKENESYHNTYYYEQEIYALVESGNVDKLDVLFQTVPPIAEGSVAHTHLRQSKNIFISTITMITRHAIKGGLDIETAYQLSDTYIQQAERLDNANAILLLSQTAIYDFTHRVADAKIPMDMSPEIFRCIQYISNNINKDISVEQIAKEVGMDRSTLSKKFKRELGFNISSYKMRRKLEEAKSLLVYSDMTISQISEYLCFSTQAYFQNVFKKKYGVTPREYRIGCK